MGEAKRKKLRDPVDKGDNNYIAEWDKPPRLNPEFLRMYEGEFKKLLDSIDMIPEEQHDIWWTAMKHILEFSHSRVYGLMLERNRRA